MTTAVFNSHVIISGSQCNLLQARQLTIIRQ